MKLQRPPGVREYLLRTSDPHLSAEDIALGYKQLFEVERGWRTLKTTLELRPVYHRLEERIRATSSCAGLPCCWSASSRPPPATPGTHLRGELDALHVGTFTGPACTYRQRTELSKPQRDILATLNLTPPKKIIELTPTPAA